ncbi:MAG: xylulokinase, partial [Planctomycetes bacterium]|nr:xylulokinase [Planctomycetota bacterium]
MSTPLYLGFDVGTQSTKALVIDGASGEVVARAASGYELIPGLPPGAAEQHPDTWWQALGTCCRELASRVDLARVRSLGVSGQQHGFVPLDAEQRVLRAAKLWCDTSTSEEAAELSRAIGRAVPTGFTASKILWMKRKEPASYARLRHVLLPHDWVNLRFTGRLAMEAGDASGTGCFDVVARRFDARACAAIDAHLHEWLPPLVGPAEPIGALRPEVARELGLPAGALVAPGSGDNMCAAIGSGATREGIAVLSLGTSATLFARASSPVIDPAGLIAPFCDATGAWLPLLCVMNATGVLHEVARAFAGEDLHTLTRAAEQVALGCEGLLCVPFLQGERVPDLPNATGSLLGWRPGLLTPGHLFRAALEGISINLAGGLERLRSLGLAIDAVRLV